MQPLVDSMVDGDSYERSLTLEALAQICTRSLRPMNQALAISLQDKNPQVRKNAIRDLTRLYDIMSQISQLICHALDDSDEEVQETARWAIRQLNLQLPPRLDIAPLETTGEPEDDDVQDTSFTETTATEVQN
jgi:HEAT repeat protein